MKYTNLRAFEKHIESAAPNHFSNLYLILSKDSYERKKACDHLTKMLIGKGNNPDLCLHIFDGEVHSIETILTELHSIGFFAKQRVIVVHNSDKLDKNATTKLENYFKSPSPSTYLVITAPTLNRATNFYKNGEKIGVMLDVPEEKPWEKEKSLQEWIHLEVGTKGKKIDPKACQCLLKQLGTDQNLLENELEKLCCYVGEREEITLRDIGAICSAVNIENGWQLGEAIFRKDVSSALRISKALLSDGTNLIALLRQIRSQFQTEYQISSLLSNGGTSQDVVQQFPYMKGQILERHLQMAQSYGMQKFKKGLLKIDETELSAKNSMQDPDFLAERLIITLTS